MISIGLNKQQKSKLGKTEVNGRVRTPEFKQSLDHGGDKSLSSVS